MLIFGAGGHARVVLSILMDCSEHIAGIFDDDDGKTMLSDYQLIGKYSPAHLPAESVVIAIGDNCLREKVARSVAHRFGKAIHPTALIDRTVRLGEGAVIMHRAVIQSSAWLGDHVIVNTAAIIEHDCRIGDFVHIAPGAILCGNVKIGSHSLIGAGSVIIPNLTIGSNCIIGAGSTITRDVPDGSVIVARADSMVNKTQTHYAKEDIAFPATYERAGDEIHSGSV